MHRQPPPGLLSKGLFPGTHLSCHLARVTTSQDQRVCQWPTGVLPGGIQGLLVRVYYRVAVVRFILALIGVDHAIVAAETYE